MAVEKLVDGDFLARLVADSYETAMSSVSEAVESAPELFGESDAERVSAIATYPDHVIVASKGGTFYRAKWSRDEDGSVNLSEAEEIDVPVYEPGTAGVQVRQEAEEAVRFMMIGDADGAAESVRSLYRLVQSGVRLTAEGVEDLWNRQRFTEHDWFKAIGERESEIRAFLGADVARIDAPKARFESLIESSADQADANRPAVIAAMRRILDGFREMRSRTALAREIGPGHRVRGADDAAGMAVSEFVEFVGGYAADLDGMTALIEDAVAVAENGPVKPIARIHDSISVQATEWGLAAMFVERLARRFEQPAAA